MHVTAEKVERRRNQSEHAGKYESRSNRLSRRKPDNQKQRRNGKTPTADSRQAHNQGDEKTQKEMHYSARSEKVWIPHSSFLPLQRPDLGFAGSTGIAVHGSQPMLRYPWSYCGR